MRKSYSYSKPNLHRSPPIPAARPIEGRQLLREAAARSSGIFAIGLLLSGHFPARELLVSGRVLTFRDPRALREALVKSKSDRVASCAEASSTLSGAPGLQAV
jgi:hypothetical protein